MYTVENYVGYEEITLFLNSFPFRQLKTTADSVLEKECVLP